MISTDELRALVAVHFQLTPSSRKFDSPENRYWIGQRVASFGVTPSDTGVFRAIQELVSEGAIARVDGGDESTDRRDAALAERNHIDRLASEPLIEADFTRYSRMSPTEVEQAFYSDAVFAARYERAAQTWGFKIPPKPAPSTDVPADSDPSQWATLDAKTYHSLPTARIIRLYQNDAGFKRAVDRLIKAGKI